MNILDEVYNHDIWLRGEFSQAHALLDLVLNANKTETTIRINHMNVVVKEGQLGWTMPEMMKRWSWPNCRVKKLMDYLVDQGLITRKIANHLPWAPVITTISKRLRKLQFSDE